MKCTLDYNTDINKQLQRHNEPARTFCWKGFSDEVEGFFLDAVTIGFSWTLFVIPALQDSRNTEFKYENTQVCFVNLQSAAQNAVKTGNYCEL